MYELAAQPLQVSAKATEGIGAQQEADDVGTQAILFAATVHVGDVEGCLVLLAQILELLLHSLEDAQGIPPVTSNLSL